ncbi:MAG: hypothetical protein ABR879_06310 [Methanomassiliicoccales archaeon]|jgi:hypothetical protein
MVVLEICAVLAARRFVNGRRTEQKRIAEESELRGLKEPDSIAIFLRPYLAYYFVGLICLIGFVGILEHPATLDDGIEGVEIAWLVIIAAPTIALLVIPYGGQSVVLLNRDSIVLATANKDGNVDVRKVPWEDFKIRISGNESHTIILGDSKGTVFVDGYYENYKHLCAWLLEHAPRNAVDEYGKYFAIKAKLRRKPPVRL